MRKTLNGESCWVCGNTYGLDAHEPYMGRNRQLSKKYGLVVALCRPCHRKVHDDPDQIINTELKEYVRKHFEEQFPELDFIKIFA